jgi:hypothetical protein
MTRRPQALMLDRSQTCLAKGVQALDGSEETRIPVRASKAQSGARPRSARAFKGRAERLLPGQHRRELELGTNRPIFQTAASRERRAEKWRSCEWSFVAGGVQMDRRAAEGRPPRARARALVGRAGRERETDASRQRNRWRRQILSAHTIVESKQRRGGRGKARRLCMRAHERKVVLK